MTESEFKRAREISELSDLEYMVDQNQKLQLEINKLLMLRKGNLEEIERLRKALLKISIYTDAWVRGREDIIRDTVEEALK